MTRASEHPPIVDYPRNPRPCKLTVWMWWCASDGGGWHQDMAERKRDLLEQRAAAGSCCGYEEGCRAVQVTITPKGKP